jgi:hypothetical protein
MLARFRARLTYANVMATIAVFVALGGSGYAAVTIDGSQLKERSVGGRKLKLDTLTGKEVKEPKLGKVPNADALDGIDSAIFTRRGCGSKSGAFHGYARIESNASFSSTFTTAGVDSPYNCSGQTVEARRLAMGVYEVRFNGTQPGLVVASSMQLPSSSPSDMNVSPSRTLTGTYAVAVADLAGNLTDWPFVIVLL